MGQVRALILQRLFDDAMYRPGQPNLDFDSTYMLLLKNLQFFPYDYETRSKLSTHEYFILAEFHNHREKL